MLILAEGRSGVNADVRGSAGDSCGDPAARFCGRKEVWGIVNTNKEVGFCWNFPWGRKIWKL